MQTWNTKRHQCLDLTATEQLLPTRRGGKILRCIEWIQDHMIRRGILLTEQEQFLGYSEQIRSTTWKGSLVSQAAMPALPRKNYMHMCPEIQSQPIQPRLRTTSAYWPLEVKSYLDEQIAS